MNGFTSRRRLSLSALAALAIVWAPSTSAQTIDTGSIRGRVTDSKGQALPGAIVKAKGPQGVKGAETDEKGNYTLPYLAPGTYEVTVTMDGYSTQVTPGLLVASLQTSILPFKLVEGTDTVIVTAAARVDTGSTTSITKINLSEAVKQFAQVHSFTGAFDFAPGAISNSGVGGGNYSIGGASGLENQYYIGGMNVTGAGYGSIGSYDVFGPRGTGLTTAFIESLDIREGGFEAEYGGAMGGVIVANLKSGGNDFHGGLGAFWTPRSLDGARNILDYPGLTQYQGDDELEVAAEFSGPIVRDRLFFYVGYNPVWSKNFFKSYLSESDLQLDGNIAPYANREYNSGTNLSSNYVVKLTWNLSERHRLDFTYLGSPQSKSGLIRNPSRNITSADSGLTGIASTSATDPSMGKRKIKDESYSIKYFGSVFNWLNIDAQVSRHVGAVTETPGANGDNYQYYDVRRGDLYNYYELSNVTPVTSKNAYQYGGLGVYQGGSNDENFNASLKFTLNFNLLGSHELKLGGEYTRLNFRQDLIYSGARPEIYLYSASDDNSYTTLRTGTDVTVRCVGFDSTGTSLDTGCIANSYRASGNIQPTTPNTLNKEKAFFISDRWAVHPRVNLTFGVRSVSQHISNPSDFQLTSSRNGQPLIGPDGIYTGYRLDIAECWPYVGLGNPDCYPYGFGNYRGGEYKFKTELSHNIGVAWDVNGNGKSRLYGNYGRLFERIPNDLAVRSFGNEITAYSLRFSNPDLTGQISPARLYGINPSVVRSGTRLPYKDDYVLGYQFELAPRTTLDIKANFRKQGRVLEDTQAASTEAILNFYYGAYIDRYCTNCGSLGISNATGLFPGWGSAAFGQYVLANVGENNPTSYEDSSTGNVYQVNYGGKPKHNYKSLSVTFQKQPGEGEHISLHAVYRISRLTGNYEGLFRNDNGQSDPNITSLYDFPLTPMTESQFYTGRLNTDTPHVLRINVGYSDFLIKNMDAALTFKWQSGQPRTSTVAHPVYANGGEIPGLNAEYFDFDFYNATGGFGSDGYVDTYVLRKYEPVKRGNLGRNPDLAVWDFKLGYSWKFSKSALDVDVLITNLFNETQPDAYDDFWENSTGDRNINFLKPYSSHDPRSIRIGLDWSF